MAEIKLTGFKNGKQSTVGDTDTALIDGSLTIGDDATEDTVVFNARVNSSIIPSVDSTYDIGDPNTNVWNNIFASNGHFNDLNLMSGAFEQTSNITNATGNTTMNCSNGHIFYLTSISGSFTPQFTNTGLDSGFSTSITLVLAQGNPAVVPTNNITIDGGSNLTVKWQGDVSPTGTVNGYDVVSYSILNNSGTFLVLGQLVSFG
jgi:hypothetical protein